MKAKKNIQVQAVRKGVTKPTHSSDKGAIPGAAGV